MQDFSDLNKSTYNKIARDYFQDHKTDVWDNDFLEDFAKRLPPKSNVLDLGCGPGIESKKMFDRGLNISGFDLSLELIKIAQQQVPTGSFIVGDMSKKLPYKDNSFDGVFAKASLLHIPKKHIGFVLDEIIRITKSNGIIHIALKKGLGEEEVMESDYGYEYRRFFSFWQPEELESIFKLKKLKIVNAEQWQNPGRNTIWLKYILQK